VLWECSLCPDSPTINKFPDLRAQCLSLGLYTVLSFSLRLVLVVGVGISAGLAQEKPETIVTNKGERFEQARITSVTPATVTISHATGVATLPLTEMSPDIQQRCQYDPARAKAWIEATVKAQTEAARAAEEAAKKAANARAAQAARDQAALDAMTEYIEAGGTVGFDRVTGKFYPVELAEARRSAAIDFYRKHGYWPTR
jgi:hypothetical protein